MDLPVLAKNFQVVVPHLKVGNEYPSFASLLDVIRTEFVVKHKNYLIKAHNDEKIIIVCANEDCSWKLRAVNSKRSDSLKITKLTNLHNCKDSGHVFASVEWVCARINESVKIDNKIKATTIQHSIAEKYHIDISYNTAWRAKQMSLKVIFGGDDASFGLIRTL
jgi:hypothetical protein